MSDCLMGQWKQNYQLVNHHVWVDMLDYLTKVWMQYILTDKHKNRGT